MPYKVEEHDGEFDVVNTETDEVKDSHENRDDAERQVRILNELEKEGDE
jgi:hypothetical protein